MNNTFLTSIITIYLSLLTLCLQGQNSSISLEETGIWNGLYIKTRITNTIGYYGEHHLRLRNNINDLNSFVGRTKKLYNRAGLNIYFNDHFEAVIGPTLVLNYSPIPGDAKYEKVVYEPRIWHQWLLIMPKMGRVKIYHQFRFEHRWKKSNEINADYKYTNRYRYKLFAYVPLNSKNIEVKSLFFSPSFELFMHSGKSVIYNPFEDFRTYNGIGYVFTPNFTLFIGHMWTLGQKESGFEYKTSHILRFNLYVGLDFRSLEQKLPHINLGY